MIVHVHGEPAPQGSMRAIRDRAGNCHVVAGGDDKAKKRLATWRKTVAAAAAEAMGGGEPWDRPVSVSVRFYLSAPVLPRWREAATGYDVDKLARALLDSLTGVVFVNDARVCRLTAEKVWGDQPGAVISILPL